MTESKKAATTSPSAIDGPDPVLLYIVDDPKVRECFARTINRLGLRAAKSILREDIRAGQIAYYIEYQHPRDLFLLGVNLQSEIQQS